MTPPKVPTERQAEYYTVIAHTRTLSPNDEMLRVLEAMGILALLTRETPSEIGVIARIRSGNELRFTADFHFGQNNIIRCSIALFT